MDEEQLAHWRDSARIVRFFGFDARAAAALMLLLMHFRLWTFVFAILVMLLFWGLEKRGLTFASALRALRLWIVGFKRPAVMNFKKRKMTDFG